MQMKAKYLAGLLLVVTAAMFALYGYSPQKRLAHGLKDADRVVVMDAYDGTTITITNDQLRMVIQALGTSRRISSMGLKASYSYTLVFFKAGAYLATVPTGACIVFYIDNIPYQDESGALMALRKKFIDAHPEKFTPTRAAMPQGAYR